MEVLSTIRDTLENFRDWLNKYWRTHTGGYARMAPSGKTRMRMNPSTFYYHAPVSGAGHVVFRVYEESDAERLEVRRRRLALEIET